MSTIMDWILTGFSATLYAAFATLPLAALALAIDTLAGRFLAARFRCLLWIVVAARLVMPAAPESKWSMQQAWLLTTQAEAPTAGPPYYLAVSSARDVAPKADWHGERLDLVYINLPPAHVVSWQSIFLDALPVTWFVVGAVILLRAAFASVRFARRLRKLSPVDDAAILQLLRSVCAELGVRRAPTVKYVAGLSSPAVFGAIRPILCLPAPAEDSLSAQELRMIMLHELTHLRRHDGLLSWAVTFVQAAQWFNPIAWLAMNRIALYSEQACDDAVQQRTAISERATYADLLLRFAVARQHGLAFVGMWFARPARQLRLRIAAFAQSSERQRRVPALAAATSLVLVAITGLTDAASYSPEDGEPRTISQWMRSGSSRPPAPTVPEWGDSLWAGEAKEAEPTETRRYDMSKALVQLAETNPRDDSRRKLLSLLSLPALKPGMVSEVDGEPNLVEATMTPRQHDSLADMLAAIEEAGIWQVAVEVILLRDSDIEAIGNVDWQDAVKFLPPTANQAQPWSTRVGEFGERTRELSISAESATWEYSPYLALKMNEKEMRRVRGRLQGVYGLNWPKVTLFSGSKATVRDESIRPFVVGVSYVKGEFATAAQPQIATLAEGTAIDVQPIVVDAGALDLRCRLAVSKVDGVSNVKLPGQDVTIQNPRLSRKTITASCRVTPGETLLIAPMIESSYAEDRDVHYYAITAQWFPDVDAPASPAGR